MFGDFIGLNLFDSRGERLLLHPNRVKNMDHLSMLRDCHIPSGDTLLITWVA